MNRFLLAMLAAGMCFSAGAVPAKRGIFTVTQPDGTELRVQQVGDEHMHFLLTEDRQLLVEENGTYYYSRIDENGALRSTNVIATPIEARTADAMAVMQSIDNVSINEVRQKRAKAQSRGISRAIDQTGMGRFTSNFPRTGKVKGLVILVQYKDVKFTVNDPATYYKNMLNKEGFNEYGGTGSARDFFIENSNGQFEPEFDVFGPFTLSQNMAYYGGNDKYGEDKNAPAMIVEGCKGLDSQINFADYDFDGDGEVDNVYVFYAGVGEASNPNITDCVWPHQWQLEYAGKSFTLDGKLINKYACSNEWEGSRPDGIGTFVHEFSHVMGLPDLYATNNSTTSVTPNSWSVLDYGPYNNEGRTPPCYSIFERNAMGWCEPKVLDGPESVKLGYIAETNEGCIIPTTKKTEFFLVENRQQTGWDKYLPGHGMLVWHVDFVQNVWDSNAVNNTASHMYVELEKASSSSTSEKGWSFPGTSGKTEFTNTTKPSMKTWNGVNINMPITNIAEKGGVITFDVAGGCRLEAPVANGAPVVGDNGFTVSWNPVEGATDYIVTVYEMIGTPAISDTYDSKTLPTGWTKSSAIGTYATTGNYKTSGQSLKLQSTGHTVTTCDYEGDVTKVSFWYKGNGTIGSTLDVNGKINGKWQLIQTFTPVNNQSEDKVINDVPAGVKAVQFVYTKDKGNLALDDMTVVSGSGTKDVLPGHEERSTGGATSYTVDLSALSRAADDVMYLVEVRATDGKNESRELSINVDMNSNAGVDDVVADADEAPVYYNLQGIEVENPTNGVYIMRKGTKVTKVIMH